MPDRAVRPVMVVDVVCVACAGVFVGYGEVAEELAREPLMVRLREPSAVRSGTYPSEAERAAFLAVAEPHARAAGWYRRHDDGAWLCPVHAERYGDGPLPRRFTIRQVLEIHRALRAGVPPAGG